MTRRGLVLDIETAPDPAALVAVGQTGRGAQGRIWLHRLVAVSLFGFADIGKSLFDDFRLESLLVTPSRRGARRDEADGLGLIEASLASLGEDGVLITFNGRRHDLPFLRMRRRCCGLFEASRLDRFIRDGGGEHVDVMELLAVDGLRWPSLDDACAAFDIPHVPHGAISPVPAALRKSETDVLATFLLYLVGKAAREQSSRCLLAGWTALAGWCLEGPNVAHRRQFATAETSRAAIRMARQR